MDVDSRHPPSPFAPCHQAAAADGCPREYVRDGKGSKDRVTMLPESLKKSLHDHLGKTQEIHERDLAEGWGRVQMPDAMDSKYPNAPAAWRWQWTSPPQENRWKNTMMYAHVLNRGPAGVRSPIDAP